MNDEPFIPLEKGLAKAGVREADRHLFLCMGPDCCDSAQSEATWEFLKRRIRELNLPAMRTKAACFRICSRGPILVVYPDGVWYSEVTPERAERILCQHVRDGRPVREWVIAENPLGQGGERAADSSA